VVPKTSILAIGGPLKIVKMTLCQHIFADFEIPLPDLSAVHWVDPCVAYWPCCGTNFQNMFFMLSGTKRLNS
jgi:hypothetical protein